MGGIFNRLANGTAQHLVILDQSLAAVHLPRVGPETNLGKVLLLGVSQGVTLLLEARMSTTHTN